jgi:hypothetical protein
VVAIRVTRIGTRRRTPNWAALSIEEMRRTLVGEIAPDIKRRFEDVVYNWEHKPKFIAKFVRTKDEMGIELRVTGKNAKIWNYVSQGTRPHRIPKTGETLLAFQWGGPGSYQPKTYPNPMMWGGPGTVRGGESTFRMHVHHPGTEARNFEEGIRKEYTRRFHGKFSAAIRRGLNKARRPKR